MTPEVLAKLDDAFMADATDEMACFLAGISQDTLYYYQTKNPGYSERKKMLKDNVRMQARMAVNKAIKSEEKPETAKWYLERRDKEYKAKSDVTTNDKDLPTPILGSYVPVHGGNQEGVGAVVPHPGGAGGNLGQQDGVDPHPADPPGADGQDPDLD